MATLTFQNTSRETPVKQQVETNADKKTKFLPPDMAVRIAWALTNQLSESESVRLEATRATQLMKDIRINVDIKDKKEEQYVNWVCAAIEATYRDLVTITNGRNLNFAEVKELRDKEMEKLNQNSQFTTNLQSSIPKISGMTIGGVGISILFTKIVPIFEEGYFLPVLAIGAAISYVIDGLYFIPRTNEKIQNQKVKLDYDRNLYYMQYINRSREALKALYISADRYHRNIFRSSYYSKEEIPEIETIIDEVLSGISPTMCNNISKCMIGNIVKPDMYAVCETGLNIENCPNNKK